MGEISCRSSFNILVMNKLFYITLFLLFTVTVSAQEAWPDVKVENEYLVENQLLFLSGVLLVSLV